MEALSQAPPRDSGIHDAALDHTFTMGKNVERSNKMGAATAIADGCLQEESGSTATIPVAARFPMTPESHCGMVAS